MKSAYVHGAQVLLIVLAATSLFACGTSQFTNLATQPPSKTAASSQPIADKQQLWINPNPYCIPPFPCVAPAQIFSQDYVNLFLKPETWESVQEIVDVFQFFIDFIPEPAVLARAKLLFDKKKIGVSVEGGGLLQYGGCDDPATHDQVGEISFAIEDAKIQALANAGITVNYFTMDGPISRVLIDGQPNNCQFTLDKAAYELADYVELMTEKHPQIRIGWLVNFPNWRYNDYPAYWGTGKGWGNDMNYADVVTAVVQKLAQRGLALSYFRIDNPYNYTGGAQNNKIADLARQIKAQTSMRLGLIYNTDVSSPAEPAGMEKNAAYVAQSLTSNDQLEKTLQAVHGLQVDDRMYESWYNYPQRLVSPTTASTSSADYYSFMRMIALSWFYGLTQ